MIHLYLSPVERPHSLERLQRWRDRWQVNLGAPDGEIILAAATEPMFAACRALKDRGLTGAVQFWRPGKAAPDFVIRDLASGAGLTVTENTRTGPRIAKWQPMPIADLTYLHRGQEAGGREPVNIVGAFL